MANDEDDHFLEMRRFADAGVRVIEGGAGDPEFDTEESGPIKWDADVRDHRRKSFEAVLFTPLGVWLLSMGLEGWVFWIMAAFTVGMGLSVPWQLFEWRVALDNRKRWRVERGLTG